MDCQNGAMTVIATLVIGKNGFATGAHSSHEVTSTEDRNRFLARRKTVDCLLIGGSTARNEPYLKTPVPVVVISRSSVNFLHANPKAHWWNMELSKAIARAQAEFGNDILIEAGPAIISQAIKEDLVDRFELSITENDGTENYFDHAAALSKAKEVKEEVINGTTFITALYS